jgi:ElaB/YqjD/DUF883 family membrane-anchored ribosome-binding protein
MQGAAKDLKDAKDTIAAKTSAAAGDIQADLETLREDVSRLTMQLADLVTDEGKRVWRQTKRNLDGAINDAQAKGLEAVDAVRDMSGNVVDALEESIQRRPYTTLALAVGLGFVIGATWRK